MTEDKKLRQYSHYPNVTVIAPDFGLPAYCTDKGKLLKLYNHGCQKAEQILRAEKIIE